MATSPDHSPRRTETVRISIPAYLRSTPEPEEGARMQGGEANGGSRVLRRLGERNHAYRQLLGSLYDAILVTAADGTIIDVNDRAVLLLQYSRGELAEARMTDFVDGADESLLEEIQASVRDGAFTVIEAWCLRRDGSQFPAEIAVHGIQLTGEGQMCFMVRDISRRIQIEREVTRLGKAVASTSDAVAIFDDEGSPVYQNPACERLLATGAEAALPLGGLLSDNAVRAAVDQALRAGGGWSGEIDVPLAGGGTTPVLFQADAIEIADQYAGAVAIMTDITQRRRSEQRLRRTLDKLEASNADLAQFAYVASHDLKEPLRGIAGYLQLLERRSGEQLEEEGRHYLRQAVRAAERMREMVNHILDYSRLDREFAPAEVVDSTAILAQATANLRRLVNERQAQIHVSELPPVRVPAARLLQVFQNLLANALKFCARPPEIRVTGDAGATEVVFRVRDNGIGIEPALVDRVFMLFQRLHTQDEYEGTGIGLATCRKLVEQWGGKIWIESSVPGEGTTFAFSAPAGPRPDHARGDCAGGGCG